MPVKTIGPSKRLCSFLPGHQEINELDHFKPPQSSLPARKKLALVDVYSDSCGVKRVKGNKQLKLSQAYPRQFLDQRKEYCFLEQTFKI